MNPTNTKPPAMNLDRSLLEKLATRAAAHPRIEEAVLGALRAELPRVIQGLLAELCVGDTVRLYVPKGGGTDVRRERDLRILGAREQPAALVAERERVSERHVRRIWTRGNA